MASLTVTPSFFAGSVAAKVSKHSSTDARCGVLMVKAVKESCDYTKEETCAKRRDMVFAVAAAAACSFAKIVMAEEEPKRGTEEAKKKYGPICVSMPTARVCHK